MRAPTQPVESRVARLKRALWLAWDSDVAWSFRHSPVALGASLVALLLVISALLAPWIAPQNAFDAASLNLMEGFTRPGEASPVTGRVFLLGTDSQGRDVFSAILYGSRVSLLVGFAAVIFSVTLGVSLGLVSGYIGGRTDAFIMRIADIQLSFPAILINQRDLLHDRIMRSAGQQGYVRRRVQAVVFQRGSERRNRIHLDSGDRVHGALQCIGLVLIGGAERYQCAGTVRSKRPRGCPRLRPVRVV